MHQSIIDIFGFYGYAHAPAYLLVDVFAGRVISCQSIKEVEKTAFAISDIIYESFGHVKSAGYWFQVNPSFLLKERALS
jgi:hypothetical protein